MADDDTDTADDIVWGAVADLELEQYTKREIIEKLREAAAEIESTLDDVDAQSQESDQSSPMMDNDIWLRGNE